MCEGLIEGKPSRDGVYLICRQGFECQTGEGRLTVELRQPGVADQRYHEALLAAPCGNLEQLLLGVNVDTDLSDTGIEPVEQGGAGLAFVLEVDPAVVLGCADLVEAALPGEGQKRRLDAGVACLGGNLDASRSSALPCRTRLPC